MLASSRSRSISLTASSRTAASGFARSKRAISVFSTLRRRLLVPILVSSSPGAVPASLERERVDELEGGAGIGVGRLDDEDGAVRLPEVQTIFEKRDEHLACAGMARLDQAPD